MKFEETPYSTTSETCKYQHVECLVEQIHQKIQTEIVMKYKNYQQEEIAEIALKICTAVLLEYMKDRVDHGESF